VVFAAIAMFAPSAAARSAIARPIPRLAPVMNNVRPANGADPDWLWLIAIPLPSLRLWANFP